MESEGARIPAFQRYCERHFAALALLVLGLAAFNLTYRLDREIVTDWDESLYAISATEMATSGQWIGVTYLGQLDYYNSKPPLNVWLIALAFKVFGTNLWSLRLASVTAALLTVTIVITWGRRCFGAAVALLAGVVADGRCNDTTSPSSRRRARGHRRGDARRGRSQTAVVFIPLSRPAPFDPGTAAGRTEPVAGPPRVLLALLPRGSVCAREPAAHRSGTSRKISASFFATAALATTGSRPSRRCAQSSS